MEREEEGAFADDRKASFAVRRERGRKENSGRGGVDQGAHHDVVGAANE